MFKVAAPQSDGEDIEMSEMTLQQDVELEELKREKECLEQRLESSNIELEGLRRAYNERCRISEEEKKELQRKLRTKCDSALPQQEHATIDISAALQLKDSIIEQKEKEIELLTSKLAQINSRLTQVSYRISYVHQ